MERRHFLSAAAAVTAIAAAAAIPSTAAAAPDAALTPQQRGDDWGDLTDVLNEAVQQLSRSGDVAVEIGVDPRQLFLEQFGTVPVSDATLRGIAGALELQAISLLALRDDLHATAAAVGRPITSVSS